MLEVGELMTLPDPAADVPEVPLDVVVDVLLPVEHAASTNTRLINAPMSPRRRFVIYYSN
jgi:hypothetical protein